MELMFDLHPDKLARRREFESRTLLLLKKENVSFLGLMPSERISDNKTKNILDTFNPVTILCSIKVKQF